MNNIKRLRKFNDLSKDYTEHPLFTKVRLLYVRDKITNIRTALNTMKTIKYKKNGEIYKASTTKYEKFMELYRDYDMEKVSKVYPNVNRSLESYFKQINVSLNKKSAKLNPIQQNDFKTKILMEPYIVEIYSSGSKKPTTMTINADYVDGFIDIITNGDSAIEHATATKFSDGMFEVNYEYITKFKFIKLNKDNVNFIDNKNGSFFNYLNTTKLDLTRYQILRKEDDGETITHEQCLMHCLKLLNIEESKINAIKLAMSCSHIPKTAMNKICELIQKQIVIYSSENKRYNKRKQYYGKKYNDVLKIAMYKNHYFVYEKTIYNKYFIDNYEKLNNIENCFNISKITKGKYYEYNMLRCDTLYMIHTIFEKGLFIKDTSIINRYVGSQIINDIPLDNIENEQVMYTNNKKVLPKEHGNIFYADCESEVIGEKHNVLMIGIICDDKEKPFIIVRNGEVSIMINSFFNYIKSNNKNGVPIVYFHNLKYDYMGLLKQYLTIKDNCVKNNQVYSVKAFYYGFEIELRDSYKLINISLSKFSSTFGLNIHKQEAIAYKYYTVDNINCVNVSIEKYKECFDKESDKILFEEIINNNKEIFKVVNNSFDATAYYKYYLEYDCLVLKQGLQKYVKIIEEITGRNNKEKLKLHDSLTISSLTNKYMGVNGAFDDVYTVSANLRSYISEAIYGGRVNACKDFKMKVIDEEINDFDGVSLYPSAIHRMCKEMGIPKGMAKKIIKFNINEDYFIGRFKITKINKRQQNPFIAQKTKNGIDYLNEVENNEPIIVTIDKITLEDYIKFHKIEYEFVDGVYWNEGFNKTMGALIYDLFTSRLEYKSLMKKLDDTSDEYARYNVLQEIIKLMMNSSYGKTILKKTDTKTTFIDNTSYNKETKTYGDENKKIESYIYNNFNTIKQYTKINDTQTEVLQNTIDLSFNLAHVGVLILSYSKRIMNEVMALASDNNIDVFYQDTDSMHLRNKDIPLLEALYLKEYKRPLIGSDLCQFHSDFKLEGAAKNAEILSKQSIFLGKKSYIDLLKSKNDKGEIITGFHKRMKGISEDALKYAAAKDFKGDYFKLYEYLLTGAKYEFILNPYKHSVSFEYVQGGIRSRGYQEFKRIVSF